jgi:hypothetical protein
VSTLNLHTLTYLLPLCLLLYQIIIDFVPLFPFNDVQSKDKRLRKYEVLGNYPPLLVISLCFYLKHEISLWIGYVITSIIMVMHLFAWWIPYFFGFPNNVRSDYKKYFSRTYKFLPAIKDHIILDAEHVGVGILLVASLVTQSAYLFGL